MVSLPVPDDIISPALVGTSHERTVQLPAVLSIRCRQTRVRSRARARAAPLPSGDVYGER